MNHRAPSERMPDRRKGWTPSVALGVGVLLGGILGFALRTVVPRVPETSDQKPTSISVTSTPKGGNASAFARAPESRHTESSTNMLPQQLAVRLREILQVVDLQERMNALRALLGTMSAEDMPFLTQALIEMDRESRWDKDASLRTMSVLEMIAGHIVTTAPESFFVDALKRKDHDMVPFVFRQWAARDFASALRFFDTQIKAHRSTDLKNDCAEAAAHEFARHDPQGTLNWVMTLDEEQRDDATNAAFRTLSHLDLAVAARLVAERSDIVGREGLARTVAGHWAKEDPEKALAWAIALPADVGREAIATGFKTIAATHGGGDLLAQWEALPAHGKDAALPVLVERDFGVVALSELISAQPEGKGRAQAAERLIESWLPNDPVAASGWLSSLAPGQTRDSAVMTFARRLESNDPEAAVVWTSTIKDGELRHTALSSAFKKWNLADPSAAASWAQSSGISAAERDELLSLPKRESR